MQEEEFSCTTHSAVVEGFPLSCHFFLILKMVEVMEELWGDSTIALHPRSKPELRSQQ